MTLLARQSRRSKLSKELGRLLQFLWRVNIDKVSHHKPGDFGSAH
jgi:hypothetical protein